MTLAEIQNLLRSVGWPESEIVRASAIAIYESGGNPNAINDGSGTNTTEYSVGLFQINTLAHRGYSIAQLKNPVTNASIALQLWRNRPNYADWYNSNRKYQNNYQGIASQAQSVFNGGGGVVNLPATIGGFAGLTGSEIALLGGVVILAWLLSD